MNQDLPMQTFILLAIAVFVAIGLGFFCFDCYRTRNRSVVDPSTFNELTVFDVATVTPLDSVSISEATPAIEGAGHWVHVAGEAIAGVISHH